MVKLSQDNLSGRLVTALGQDELCLVTFRGSDGVNELFEYHIDAVSHNSAVEMDNLIGTQVSVEIETPIEETKWFHGTCVEARWNGQVDKDFVYSYSLVLRPWFWLATKRRDQRIFHQKTVTEIIETVLGRYGGKIEISAPPGDALEYTVQYRETDYDFCCRLMERFGYNYFFDTTGSDCVLHITGNNDDFAKIAGSNRNFYPTSNVGTRDEEILTSWGVSRRLTTGKVTISDYNFKKPDASMSGDQAGENRYDFSDIETYHYPGQSLTQGASKKIARIHLDQELSEDNHVIAKGNLISLSSGMRVIVDGVEGSDGDQWLCLRAVHRFGPQEYGSSNKSSDTIYDGTYTFFNVEDDYVGPRKTPLSRVSGPQTAVVTTEKSNKGDEIDCDEWGRILVKFHWDRGTQEEKDKQHSMRCRVAQMWAGNKWGAMNIPRVGMEVVVDFIEGDPDQPLVVGCVYNAENMPPYVLPKNKNISGIKSYSTKGGSGYNELAFDDTKDKELFRQHAQKDMLTKVLNDETREIDNTRTSTIGKDEKLIIKNKRATEISKDETLEIGGKRTTKISGNEALTIKGSTTIKDNMGVKIESKKSIELKVGPNTVKIDATGIKINGINVDIKASAMLTSSGGAMATHKAGGIMTIQGALVKIN
ncbi:MAG: type VI secretion system secreted protein VgrG [Paracoccaceae bacterium]|jgi:type VI secretion system secreted protein VgrG